MDDYDIIELAWRSMGKTDEEAEKAMENDDDIEQAIFDKYDCSFETFAAITKGLVVFTQPLQSPVTRELFQAFVDPDQHRAIFKKSVQR